MHIIIVDRSQTDVSDLDSILRLAGHRIVSTPDLHGVVWSVGHDDVALVLIVNEPDSLAVESIRRSLRQEGYSNAILCVTDSYVHMNGRSAGTEGG